MIYHVNPDVGSDTNRGDCFSSPFRHVPGSALATGHAAAVRLQSGDLVLIEGKAA
jgi:hypothetical protein